MKIAVLSDVHGNIPALSAVLEDLTGWGPDQVIVNGDLINRGPCSAAVMDMLSELPWASVMLQGNHEAFVLDCAGRPLDETHPAADLERFSHWTARQIGDRIDIVRRWGDHVDVSDQEAGASLHVTHGSRLGNRAGLKPEATDQELRHKIGDPRDLFVGSHTHRPMVRRVDESLVVNTGSVGQPFDGDPRAAYGRFWYSASRWHVRIARVAYDKQRADLDFDSSGFLHQCGPLARLIRIEHARNQMHVGHWMGRYLPAVKAGQVSVAGAVDEYVSQHGL